MPHPAMSPDNVAVITGGAAGIGLAAAMRFARLGMKVCIADRRRGKACAGVSRPGGSRTCRRSQHHGG